MAVDKNKIIAEATKLVQKGAHDKAIAAYQKILAADPKDSRILLKVAELQQKKGDDKAAAEAFKRVADTYAEQGFFLKAVAVYKQIVKLDPDDVGVNERLAGLYQQLGLLSDAMSQYQLMASSYERAGDPARLTEVLRRMVELDPENIASSVKLGELCARSGDTAGALDHFRRAAEHLKRHNRADEYLKIAERVAALLPDDLSLTRELANIYLSKGDTKRALAKLQLCFKANPKDVETLNLLAQAFRDLGQTSKTVSVYKELAHVHAEEGRGAESRATWRRVQELAPDDPEVADALGAGAPSPAAAPPRAPSAGPPPGPTSPGPQAQVAPEAVAKLLTETDVYVKYGLHDKALDHLKKVLGTAPEHAEALERVREIHAAAGRPGEAADVGARAVRAHLRDGRLDLAREALDRLRQLAPSHAAISELASAVGVTEEVSLGSAEEVSLASEEISLAGAEADDLAEVDEGILAPAPVREDEDALALAAAHHGDEEIVDDEPVGGPAGGDDEPVDLEVEEPRQKAPAPSRSARPPARPARPAPEREPDLSDEIEEADFFLQQGLVDEAREALESLLERHPGHAVVRARLADLDRRAAPPAPKAPRGAPEPLGGPRPSPSLVAPDAHDESFDIARELADELDDAGPGPSAVDDDFQYSVEDVFNQFKKGVEQTVKKEDSATHYDLGIAYHEMGLLDDAIHEFETALAGNDRKKEVDALSMIGLCRMAQGETKKAVAAWRRALRSEHLTRDAAKAIQYELGVAYQSDGDREAALWYLNKTAKADPGFRDAGKRLAALGGGPGRPPPDAEGGASPRPQARAAPNGPARTASPPAASRSAGAGPKKNIGYL